MAQTVSILTWNVQNYGQTKASFSDIVNSIAATVLEVNPDIFVLLEVNTNSNATAGLLMNTLARSLHRQSGGRYRICVRSPNTGVEYYGFFVRDDATTQPLVAIRKGVGGDVPVIGKRGVSFAQVEFRRVVGAAPFPRLLGGVFPLLSPDFPAYTLRGRSLGVLDWPGVRLPVLGMFWCTGATGINRLLPIVACHFAANHRVAERQVRSLNTFSLLQGVGPADPSGRVATTPLSVDASPAGGATAVPGYVLTGDFNLNWLDGAERGLYDPATGANWPQLGATLYIRQGTHLTTYGNYSPRTMPNTADLAVNDYDNVLVRNSPAAMSPNTVAGPGVRNVPEQIRLRRTKLYQSVDHYAELDKKGFEGGQYKGFATDYLNQLGAPGRFMASPINVKGSLVGARLISDHLPVYATLQLP